MTRGVHLVVLIHGLYGNPGNLAVLKEELEKADKESVGNANAALEIDILVCKSFQGSHTWDGVDVNAYRAAVEIDGRIQELEESGAEVGLFSVMGYSLGGLVARYLVGVLHSRSPSFFQTYPPGCFSTAATPHLGILKYGTTSNALVHSIGRRLFSRSGRQMYASDSDWDGRPVLEIMADPNYIFLQALQRFPRVQIIANGCHDLTVPYPTASISVSDPFVDYLTNSIDLVIEDNTVMSYSFPSSDSRTQKRPTRPTSRAKQKARADQEEEWLLGELGSGSEDEVEQALYDSEDESRNQRLKMGTPSKTALARPSLPPVFLLSLPWPFSHALILLIPFLIPVFLTYAFFTFILHSYQSAARTALHQATASLNPSEKTPLLSDPLRHPRLLEATAPALDRASEPASRASTPPVQLHPPHKVPLHLTPAQEAMVRNINDALPDLERVVAWLPWAYNSHASLIARDVKRFKFQEEGRVIVRRWANWVVENSSTPGSPAV